MRNVFLLFSVLIMVYSCSSQKHQQKDIVESTPTCIKNMINKFDGTVDHPYRNVYSYTYQDKTVYYVELPTGGVVWSDGWTDLYDGNCNLIAHPDGGMTGKGDGRAKDFFEKRSDEKIIFKWDRK